MYKQETFDVDFDAIIKSQQSVKKFPYNLFSKGRNVELAVKGQASVGCTITQCTVSNADIKRCVETALNRQLSDAPTVYLNGSEARLTICTSLTREIENIVKSKNYNLDLTVCSVVFKRKEYVERIVPTAKPKEIRILNENDVFEK